MTNRSLVAASAALLLALAFFVPNGKSVFAQGPSCGLLQDCTFDHFYEPDGAGTGAWKIFKLSGHVGIGLHPVEGWPKGPSVWFQSQQNAPFDALIFQQVAVTPGLGYHFTIPFAVVNLDGAGWNPDNQVNRRLGFDPFGGTDPTSSNVNWSADYFGKAKVTESIDFDEYARAATVTVFIRVTNPYTDKHVDVFLDTPSFDVNTSMTPIQVSNPTATTAPPTTVPTNVPPTVRPTHTNTATGTRAATATLVPTINVDPTETLVALALTDTPAPTETLEPSVTPTRRPTRGPAVSLTPVADTTQNVSPLALGVFGAVGLIGIVGAAVLFGLAIFFWRRGN